MDKQAFKQRMQNLKSYRENNPGKGYWDWKVQAYQNGGDIPLWQQYQYSGPSYQDVLDDLKQIRIHILQIMKRTSLSII